MANLNRASSEALNNFSMTFWNLKKVGENGLKLGTKIFKNYIISNFMLVFNSTVEFQRKKVNWKKTFDMKRVMNKLWEIYLDEVFLPLSVPYLAQICFFFLSINFHFVSLCWFVNDKEKWLLAFWPKTQVKRKMGCKRAKGNRSFCPPLKLITFQPNGTH